MISFDVICAGVDAQCVAFPAGAGEPPLQLRGFTKVVLDPGDAAPVALELTDKDLTASHWSSLELWSSLTRI